MQITVKPFSRGAAPIRLCYGKLVDGEFVPTADVRKATNFSEFGKREVSGRYGTPSYTEEYDLNIEGRKAVIAVQKWHGLGSTSPRKVWEVVYQPKEAK